MKPEQQKSREAILNSAIELFAGKGYSGTTIRELCKKADTYQLAINYHFGSKENLYKEVLLTTYQNTGEKELPRKNKKLSYEEQLKEIISLKMNCIFVDKEKGIFYKILSWESNLDCSLNDFFQEIINLTVLENHEYLKNVIKNISNNKNDEFMIEYLAYSIISQIKGFAHSGLIRKKIFGVETLNQEQVNVLVNQITDFTIAGVKNIKNEDK